MIGIYKITSPSGKVYIGESKDIKTRFRAYKRLDCEGQRKLYRSLNKYGIENHKFEIIMECDENDLLYFESCFQEIYISVENGLNLRYTEREGKKQVWSQESLIKLSNSLKETYKNPDLRKKISEIQKQLYENGYINPNKGINQTKEIIEKRVAKIKGRVVSESQKEKQSKTMKQLYENGFINPNKGVKKTDSQIQKIKDNHCSKKEGYVNPNKGKKLSQKQIEKMKDNHYSKKEGYVNPMQGKKSGKPSLNAKEVINNQNGFVYDSALRAYEASGIKISYKSFARKLSGERKNDTNFEYC